MKNILIINGPNLNLLGIRDNSIYGAETLDEMNSYIIKATEEETVKMHFEQSNHVGEIIDLIQNAEKQNFQAIVINAGGYSHSSIAIHDALEICKLPKIEVHLSNILNREEFRANSLISRVCDGSIIGMGKLGYVLAVKAAIAIIHN